MKKYILIFLFFSVGAIAYLSFPFKSKANFVSIRNNKFFLDNKEFYPLAINYILSFQTDGNEIWPAPYIGYNPGFKYRYTTKDSCLQQLKADMDMIREMGFNTVRFVGLDYQVNEKTGGLSVLADKKGQEDRKEFFFTNEQEYERYFSALDNLFKTVGQAGLKAIILNKVVPDQPSTEFRLIKITQRFKNEPALMAYDFFNEPLYFDKPERPKRFVYETVKRWAGIVKMYAPHQLSTIGLEGIREVFEWDPNILELDFISLHPYEYEPEQVRNEIAWYGKYIEKPWIIGETSIPADGDSVKYEEQAQFANKTLKQAFNCGAAGYSWWQYKDVEWHAFHANFMGVINMTGETRTKSPNLPISGTVKPVASEFKKFDALGPKSDPVFLPNYYNYSQHKGCRIKGKLSDENGKPVAGGVVLGWNEGWEHSYHTISREDGSFELLGDFQFYHWMASATKYSMVRGDISPDTAKKQTDNIPTMNLGLLNLERLSFVK